LKTLLLLFKKYKDVPSKSTGTDACAGAYMEEPLLARMLFPFLLSLVLVEVSPLFTSRARVEQLQLALHRREAPPALAEM
jgi:hypothetical protein